MLFAFLFFVIGLLIGTILFIIMFGKKIGMCRCCGEEKHIQDNGCCWECNNTVVNRNKP
jgi:anaerobic ribonucleoside-triphosphate reductase